MIDSGREGIALLGSIPVAALIGFAIGCLSTLLAAALYRRHHARQSPRVAEPPPEAHALLEDQEPGPPIGIDRTAPISPHLVSLLAAAIRKPVRQLRREGNCTPNLLGDLERVAWQARMLVVPPRPMQAKLVSPATLLQEASEKVPALGSGAVGISWSLMTRQPVQVDPERARAAFHEILSASADQCGTGGRLAVRVLAGVEEGYPVHIEIESGAPAAELDPLAFLVARHLLENQGAKVATDGPITHIRLRSAPPEPTLPPGLEI